MLKQQCLYVLVSLRKSCFLLLESLSNSIILTAQCPLINTKVENYIAFIIFCKTLLINFNCFNIKL